MMAELKSIIKTFHVSGIVFIAVLSALAAGCGVSRAETPRAGNGVINLAHWDFDKDGTVVLDGQWEFYWMRLLSPADFHQAVPPPRDSLIDMPGIWNDLEIGGKKTAGTGFATYRLTVKLGPHRGLLGLKILDAATAYRLYANGIEIASNGVVSESPENGRPQYLPMVVMIPGDAVQYRDGIGVLELVIQVSNHHHRKGGLWESIRLGTYGRLLELREEGVVLTFFLTGVIIIMGLYHLGLYLLRREEIATLYFSLLALIMSMRSLIINDRIFIHWFPSFSWDVLVSLEYITAFCNIVIIALFVGALYPKEMKRGIVIVIVSIGLIYAMLFTFTKIYFFSLFKPAYDLYVLLGGGCVIACLLVSSIRKRESALIALGGMTLLYFTGINDVLYNAHIINTTNLAPLGLFIYIFSQSHLLSRRFSLAMKSVERLGDQLADLNINLERKVLERTEELQAAFEELEAMNDQLVDTQNTMTGELELARKIQRQLIPQIPPENFRIYAHYLPMELVGGDFFDYIQFRDKNRIGIFLSDVSGHGVPAALITSMMKSFILQAGTLKESPAMLLKFLNENFKAYAGGNFITAFYCIYDSTEKSLVYSNAGHNPPVLAVNGTVRHLDSVKSVPLGIMTGEELERRGKTYSDCMHSVEEGGRLLLYTDGLTDVQKHDEPSSYFGDVAMMDYIDRNLHLQPPAFVFNLMQAIRDYQDHDSFKDDICIICMDL
jgi:serine phosphatase RsbU (regulator of sigma subunit)